MTAFRMSPGARLMCLCFVMMHGYKGAGLEAERESMADDDPLAAIQLACENKLSLSIRAKRTEKPLLGLCAELTEQPGKRLVHLINYRTGEPFEDVRVNLRVPAGRQTTGVLLASPQRVHVLTIPFEQEGDIVTFNVPAVDVYEIAAVTMK